MSRGTRGALVLGNGASMPKGRKRYKSVERLEYRPDGPSPQNIRLSLPDFVRDVFFLPDRVLDLLEIAAYVYFADRLLSRGRRDAVEYHSWARSIDFKIRVRDYQFWTESGLAPQLADALEFLTGDERYEFSFEAGHTTPRTSLFDREECVLASQVDTAVLLFSGGLDSLAGAIEELTAGREQVCLVSHRASPGIKRTQDSLVRALCGVPEYHGRVRHYPFEGTLTGMKAVDETQRSRAFLYTSIAFALGQALGNNEILVYENGVTSINFARREDASLGRTSRTTHPKTLLLLQQVYSTIAGKPVTLRDPFLWKTKAEVFQLIRDRRRSGLISSAVSCGHTRRGYAGATHCGTCFQCVDRRLAAHASGCDGADSSGIYAHGFTESLNGEAKTTVVDYIRQAIAFATWNEDRFYTEKLNELADQVDYLPGSPTEMEAVPQVFELCQRHGEQVIRGLRQIQEKHDDLRLPHARDSFLEVVSYREYLKEPVRRLTDSVVRRLAVAIPTMFAKGRLPANENDLNQKIKALLDAERAEFAGEHPAVSFACAKVVPDHTALAADLLIEAKFVRDGTPPSKASEGIAADLTKYPREKHALFIVFDPDSQILDVQVYQRDFESRGNCTVRVVR